MARGIETNITRIRRKVFTEVARLAYEGGDYASKIEDIPFRIVPGDKASYRTNIFLERAIVSERLRLEIGLPLRNIEEYSKLSDGIEESAIAQKYYDPPLINVIKFACNACPEKSYHVTNLCQGCLAHPCVEVCPKDAIHMIDGKSVIDQEKCIKCGRCAKVCQYGAINLIERPCAKSCGVNAIHSDAENCAEIDYDRCVSCGQCLVNCPFGAIADKGQLFQVVHAIKTGEPVIAMVAPAFIGQLGDEVPPTKLRSAFKALGFKTVIEVAIGADLCTLEEAKDFMREVPEKLPFMGTSCCPAWSAMAKKEFPDLADCISMTMTPMVLSARLQKKEHPKAKIVFVGPCSAKKLEASRRSVRSDVDFVLTFEELMSMFEAKGVDFASLAEDEEFHEASADGRGFAVGGGVAGAVVNAIKHMDPEREVKTMNAEGLTECRKMLTLAKVGKLDGYLLEGMACPGGCVAGPGMLQDPAKSAVTLAKYKAQAPYQDAKDDKYEITLSLLHE